MSVFAQFPIVELSCTTVSGCAVLKIVGPFFITIPLCARPMTAEPSSGTMPAIAKAIIAAESFIETSDTATKR